MKATTRTCSIDGCTKPVIARGWCTAHWTRWKRHGDPLAGGVSRNPAPDSCTVDGCTNPHFARGMCATHWRRARADADPQWHEDQKQQRRQWHARDPERIAEYRRRSRALHYDATNARIAKWRQENPDRVMLHNWQRRRREYGLPENTVDVVHPGIVWERDGGICQICRRPIDPDLPVSHPMSATVDHIVPVSDAASEHSYANTQLAHFDCNRRKAAAKESA